MLSRWHRVSIRFVLIWDKDVNGRASLSRWLVADGFGSFCELFQPQLKFFYQVNEPVFIFFFIAVEFAETKIEKKGVLRPQENSRVKITAKLVFKLLKSFFITLRDSLCAASNSVNERQKVFQAKRIRVSHLFFTYLPASTRSSPMRQVRWLLIQLFRVGQRFPHFVFSPF